MPLGIQRINAKKSQPNDRIIFIKPLKGPDEAIAQDFLERIAAQCLPIMREHALSVTSLEEYEFNREFVGRNFNAGEVIQLVLRSQSGHWLPFSYVQMVMMHELAHCKQMNHSRAFWAVRNAYADQMRALWARGFTGEGLWGRGAKLATGEFERDVVDPGEQLVEHLCGGTYRSRTKRKRKGGKAVLTYQEQKERRILKKFGANGVVLGEDVRVKKELEKGRTVAAKPRVAASKRGRDLRAAAALARFDQAKKEEEEVVELDSDSEEEYEYEEGVDAVDLDGKRLVDGKGRGMIKVCEDENPQDQDAKNELDELRYLGSRAITSGRGQAMGSGTGEVKVESKPNRTTLDADPEIQEIKESRSAPEKKQDRQALAANLGAREVKTESKPDRQGSGRTIPETTTHKQQQPTKPKPPSPKEPPDTTTNSTGVCPVCSFANNKMAPTCAMCANVLHVRAMRGVWACSSQTCRGSSYRNAADCGVCGVCGERKPTSSSG